LLVGYLILLSLGLWWLLRRIVHQISRQIVADPVPAAVSRRLIATWALASALVIVPIGATLSPAWQAINSLLVNGEIRQVETPKIGSAEDAKAARERSVPDLSDLSSVSPDLSGVSQPGDVYEYQIILDRSTSVIWSFGWCATSQEILEENFENIKPEFFIGETEVSMDNFVVVDSRGSFDDSYCREYYAVVSTWPRGRFQLETRVTFLADIDDGTDVYPVGTHFFRYIVTVRQ
jgi:hypothetical protein